MLVGHAADHDEELVDEAFVHALVYLSAKGLLEIGGDPAQGLFDRQQGRGPVLNGQTCQVDIDRKAGHVSNKEIDGRQGRALGGG
jgi:hypothetical protein